MRIAKGTFAQLTRENLPFALFRATMPCSLALSRVRFAAYAPLTGSVRYGLAYARKRLRGEAHGRLASCSWNTVDNAPMLH
jgi:hypothetical protein